jgi:hypothetical protein
VGSRKWLINDVPDRLGDRRTNGARTIAAVVAALAATLVAAAIAGCGGGGSSTSTSASVSTTPTTSTHTTPTTSTATSTGGGSGGAGHGQTPQQAVNGVLTKVGPDNCVAGGNVTEHYIHAAYGDTGGCIRAQNKGAAAKSLDSYSQKITGNTGTVEVRPVGGIYDGEKITVLLVKEDGGWKVDALKSNAPVGP